MGAALEGNNKVTLSPAAKLAIHEQLDRLLASSYFSHSKRFPNFLRFVVEQTLAGDADDIKERTLGIEIFGKDADYDTAADPIVRVTAAEIRKRVAQYYQEPAHNGELRITLPSGSYVPQFHSPKGGNVAGLPESDPVTAQVAVPAVQAAAPAAPPRRRWSIAPALILVLAALIAGGAYYGWKYATRSAFEFFWQPILTTGDPVLICVADQTETSGQILRDSTDPTREILLKPMSKPTDNLTTVAIDDLSAIVRIAGLLQSHGKKYSLRGEGATSLADLRSGPAVFIGAFDNAWTLRLTNPLRYHFSNNTEMTEVRIVDGASPRQQPNWVVSRAVQDTTNNYRDYAIVARFTDTNTGKLTVIVAGLARGGTIAAGEFLTDAGDMAQLMRAAKAAGDKKNMEVVLSTQIIDGEPGTPKMEATYFW
ncbi:MAG: hypothetical protein ABR928_03655 [Terracidiphilus sp.]|jgi:hypothetical protein